MVKLANPSNKMGEEHEEQLPDTLTPIVDVPFSQRETNLSRVYWGRLLSARNLIPSIDLVDDSFTFGRSSDCTLMITSQHCHSNFLVNISKKHFCIKKCNEDNLAYITDVSKNGTFINEVKLGKGNKKILKHNDKISIANRNLIYIYLCEGSEGVDKFFPPELVEKYAHIRYLGRGSCGEVRLVKDRSSFKLCAVKKIIKGQSNSSQLHRINHPTKIANEINILRSLSHPCVIGMEEILELSNEVYIVLEYMAGGELSNKIISVQDNFNEEYTKFYFYQLLLAVQYLHLNGVIHRDLKPENILLLDDRQETVLKVTDFGLSKITNDSNMTTMCGTLRYVAPEVISTDFREYGEYGKEVDIWSLGVILFYMLSKEFPFHGDDVAALRQGIVTCSYGMADNWSNVSDDAQNLVKRMLILEPKRRIKIEDIFRHPWIQKDHGVKYRVEKLLQQHGFENPIDYLVLEPPEKKFKFNSFNEMASSSDGSDETLIGANSFIDNAALFS